MTLRDNLAVMGTRPGSTSSTRSTTRSHGDRAATRRSTALPERPTRSCSPSTRCGRRGSPRRRPTPGVPSVVIPGGGVVEGGEAAAEMQRDGARHRDPPRDRAARAQLHGHGRLDDQHHELHRRREPVAAARARRGPGPVGERHRRVHPRARDRGSGTAGSCRSARRPCSTCATTSRTASTTPRPTRSCCSSRASSGPSGSSRWPTARWRSGKPILAVKVGPVGAGPGRGRRAQREPRGRGPGHRRGARRRGRDPLRRPRRALEQAELIAGAGRLGRSVGRGRTGVVTVSTGRGVAGRRPRGRAPASTSRRSRTPRARRSSRGLPTMGYIGNPLDPWGADDERRRLPRGVRGARGVRRLRRAGDRPRLARSATCPSEVEVARDRRARR